MGVIDTAITRIRDRIAAGELAPGDRLPPEAELAALLGVSRNSLREAVRALIQANVLDVRRGDGTYVTSLEPQLLLSGLAFVVDLMQDRTVLELFEVRRLLEPTATGVAAGRITDDSINGLRGLLEAMRRTTTAEELIALDVEFHRSIVQASGNQTLVSLLDALFSRTARARIWRGIWDRGALDWTYAQHELIVEALAQRDATLATAAATVHVAASERWIRHLLEDDDEPVAPSPPAYDAGAVVRAATPDGVAGPAAAHNPWTFD
ncbi:FadR/GntR family transcriptional regulator [Blastococcus montanus]|uniref:FadR/GntR family transcriptional regulator n=1 Tax=Blastococcus montanus TaxID=3144973 RepID=UPI00320B7495